MCFVLIVVGSNANWHRNCCRHMCCEMLPQVAQLAGYVSEHSAYHHGEASLSSTIVGLAQNFVGSNNVNLLYPSGAVHADRLIATCACGSQASALQPSGTNGFTLSPSMLFAKPAASPRPPV